MATKGRPGIYLIAAVFAAVLSACFSVFDAKPSSGSYAEINIVEMAPGQPAVTVNMIKKKSGSKSEYGPFTGKFYLRPGEYRGIAACNRPLKEGEVGPGLIGTADAPYYNFDFSIADGTFTFDCRYGKDGQEFILTGDKLFYDEDTGQSIPPAPDPGEARPPPDNPPPAPDPGTAPPAPDPGTAPPAPDPGTAPPPPDPGTAPPPPIF